MPFSRAHATKSSIRDGHAATEGDELSSVVSNGEFVIELTFIVESLEIRVDRPHKVEELYSKEYAIRKRGI